MMKHLTLAAVALSLSLPAAAQETPAIAGSAIEGVVAADAQWKQVWSGPMTADGMSTAADGNVLFAQEQSNAIWKLWPDGRAFVQVPYVLGAGASAVDAQGNLYAVERGCSDPGLNGLECDRPSAVMQLTPQRRVIASSFADGASLGRLNDLAVDGEGGAYYTQGGLFHASADGTVTTIYEAEAFTNGVALSADGNTLYVTDMRNIIAFQLNTGERGATSGIFATLSQDTEGFGGDGMALDGAGRLYVTGDAGVYVFAPDGEELGVIPTPRRSITVTLAGPDRNQLYIGAMGAVTPAGEEWATPEGVRNVAMTVYRMEMDW